MARPGRSGARWESSQERLFEIAERGRHRLTQEERQALQHGIDMGRGGIWLELTEEQYRRLKGDV